MPASTARVLTSRSRRYVEQICRHLENLGGAHHRTQASPGHSHRPAVRRVLRSGGRGVLEFEGGRCVLQTSPDALVVSVEAVDPTALHRIEAAVADRLRVIGHREGLTVRWNPGDQPGRTGSDDPPLPADADD